MTRTAKILKKTGKIFLWIFVGIVSLILLLFIFINLPVGKRVVRNQVVSYLEKKLKTKVSISKIDYSLPKSISLEGVYLEDLQKDTLIYGELIAVKLSMLKLISGEINIQEAAVSNLYANLYRNEKDSFFNYQFIADAFASPSTQPEKPKDTTAMKISLDKILLNRVRLNFIDKFSGTDMHASIQKLIVSTNTFQPDKMKYFIDEVDGDGINFTMDTYKTEGTIDTLKTVDTAQGQENGIFVKANKFLLKNAVVRIDNKISGLHYDNNINRFGLSDVYFNMKEYTARANSIQLDSSTIAFISPKIAPVVTVKDTVIKETTAPWNFQVNDLAINHSNIKYFDASKPQQPGLDFTHLDITNLNALVSAFKFSEETTKANVQQLAFKDQSGFALDTTHVDFVMTDTALIADNIYIKTPGSLIQKSVSLRYDSLAGITTSPQNSFITALLPNTRISFNDLYLLVPALKTSLPPAKFAGQTVDLNTEIRGNLQRMFIPYFQLVGLSGSKINAKATLYNVTDPKKLRYDLEIVNSQFLKRDLLKFIPPEQLAKFADLPSVFNLSGTFKGSTNDIVANLTTSGKGFSFSGILQAQNLSNPAVLTFNADVRNLALSKSLIVGFLPPAALESINLPNQLSARGKLTGNTNNIETDLKINSSYGAAALKGFLNNIKDPTKAKYNLAFSTPGFDVGKLIKQDTTIGVLAGNFTAVGTGFDYKTMVSKIKANVNSFGYNKYDYKNVVFNADLNNGRAKVIGEANDPNLRLSLDLLANVKGEYPTASGFIRIDTVQLHKLNLYDSVLAFSGLIKVDAKNLRPRQLDAALLLDSFRLRIPNGVFLIDTVSVLATSENGVDSIRLRAPFATLTAGGAFDYDKVGASILQYINNYYKLPGAEKIKPVSLPEQQLSFEGIINQSPIVTAFVPGLTSFEDINFKGSYASADTDSALNFNAEIPSLHYANYSISNGVIDVNSKNEKINYDINFDTLNTGTKLIYKTFARGAAARDSISLNARTQDAKAKDWFGIAGTASTTGDSYAFRLQDSLILNYEKWTVAQDNYISYSPAGIIVNNFLINNDTSSIAIKSTELIANSPINLSIKNFDLETISSLASGDTLLASGVMDVTAQVSDLNKTLPGFTGNLSIRNLEVLQTPVGTLTAKGDKAGENEIAASMALDGEGNDIKASGNYFLNNDQKQFDAKMDINAFSFRTIQGLAAGQLKNSTGNIHGNFAASGKFTDPRWNGQLFFDTTRFTPTVLGTPFIIDNQKIVFEYPQVRFPSFTIQDSLQHKLTIDGNVGLKEMTNPDLNLNINAKDFVVVNAKQSVESQFFGYAAVDADIRIKGTGVAPKIEGDLFVSDKSDITILLPEANYAKNEGLGIVRFIDRDTFDINPPVVDFIPAKEVKKSFGEFLNYNLNVQINKEAKVSIVIDPVTGDRVQVQGDARLNVGVDPGGNLILAGNYNLDKGFYDFHYQFITRKFDLLQGSTITFAGEPLEANVNIRAAYTASTSAQELVGNEVSNTNSAFGNALKQKLPFQVILNLSGPLSKPAISFDISLSEDDANVNSSVRSTIESKLAQIRDDEAATNKQVFALLVFGRFVGEQSSDFFKGNGDGGGLSSIARQSVSQFLSEALNQIAGDLIKGVNIDLNLNSYNDYGNSNGAQRTDLNVAVSKNFLNDRLTVSVGNNFGLEGQDDASKAGAGNAGFKPNISLGYKLTKDGRYLLKAYTKNQYEATVDGYVVETGLSFVVTLSYDKFRELFHSKKKKK